MSAFHINIPERKTSNRQGPLCESNSRCVRLLTFIVPLGSMTCSQKLLDREIFHFLTSYILNTNFDFILLVYLDISRLLFAVGLCTVSFRLYLLFASFCFPKFYLRVRFAVPIVIQLFTFLQLLLPTCIELFFFPSALCTRWIVAGLFAQRLFWGRAIVSGICGGPKVLGHVISLYFGFAPSVLSDCCSTFIFMLLLTEKQATKF